MVTATIAGWLLYVGICAMGGGVQYYADRKIETGAKQVVEMRAPRQPQAINGYIRKENGRLALQ